MDNLPNELLLEIFSQLSLDDRLNVLPVSLVNRRFHELANELLYSSYSVAQADPALFIRAIASSPNLGRCVQDVNWDCRSRNNYALVTSDAIRFSEDFSTAEGHYIRETLGVRGSLDMRDLNKRFNDLGAESYLYAFLSFTPRVSTLNVAVPSLWNRHMYWFKPALDSQMFANLHKAYIVGPMHIRNLLPLFLVPSLRTLILEYTVYDRNLVRRGVQYEWSMNSEVFERLQREGSWVENFHLTHCFEPIPEITWLMGVFHNLKTFEVQHLEDCVLDPEVNLRMLMQAFQRQRKSLTSLSIAAHHRTLDPSILEPLKVLTHVESLSLDISPETEEAERNICLKLSSDLSGCLPRNVEHFRLIANNLRSEEMLLAPSSTFVDALLAFSHTVKVVFPNLRTLAVDEWDPLLSSFACQTQIKILQQAFAGKGVELLARPSARSIYADDEYGTSFEDVEEGWVCVKWIMPPALPRAYLQ